MFTEQNGGVHLWALGLGTSFPGPFRDQPLPTVAWDEERWDFDPVSVILNAGLSVEPFQPVWPSLWRDGINLWLLEEAIFSVTESYYLKVLGSLILYQPLPQHFLFFFL